MWTLENHLAHPVRRQHARFTVMCWRLLTLIRSLRTPFAGVGGCSTAGTAGMYVSRREAQEEFYAHSHEVSGEPQNTPGVLDEQRLTVSTAQRQGPEPDVKPPETQPGEAPAPEVTSPFAPHASAAPAPVPPESEAPCGGRRDARYRASPGGGDNAGKDDPAVPRTLLRLAFGRLVAIAEK